MAKPPNYTSLYGGAFASVAGQRIAMPASKWKSGYGGGQREYPAPRALSWLLGGFADWIAYLDGQILSGDRWAQQTRTLLIPGAAFEAGLSSATYSQSTDGFSDTNNAAGATAPIILPVGVRVTAVRLRVKDSATGPSTVACRLNRYTFATDSTTNVATSPNSAGTGANQTLSITGLTETMASGVFYSVVMLNQSGTAATKCHGAEIDYDELV